MLEEFEFIEYEMPNHGGSFGDTVADEETFGDFLAKCNKSYPELMEYRKRYDQWYKAN